MSGSGPATRFAWFDCGAGASGDMLLGALVDAGAPLAAVQAAVDALGVEPVLLVTERVKRGGLEAAKLQVKVERSTVIRTWGNIRDILEHAELPEPVRVRALEVFSRLAHAEAAVHRTTPDAVHFHEVGALDALADVVGTCAALHALGVTSAAASPVALGSGMIRSDHGLLPVPTPAVLNLLADAGAPAFSGPARYEMCTPTGAALLTATCGSWGPMPPMRVRRTGVGAGSRDLDEVPNVLRVVLGELLTASDAVAAPATGGGLLIAPEQALLLETNVDDLDPRLWPPVLARLLDAGAADAWLTPILMKKGRPAYTLSVLLAAPEGPPDAAPDRAPGAVADAVRRTIFTETSTLGIRERLVGKRVLDRQIRTVEVAGCQVRVKTAVLDGVVVNAQPEYEDVLTAAGQLGRPVKAVLAAANAAAHAAGFAP